MNDENIKHRSELWKTIPAELWRCPMVEVGVAEGNFSEEILNWPCYPTLYLVDRWASVPSQRGDASSPQEWHDSNYARVCERIKLFGSRARIMRGSSEEMSRHIADWSLSLVYIDADHSYEGVKRDINAWFPKVRTGGVMAFHDYENPNYGVKKAVQEFCWKSWLMDKSPITIHSIPENKPEDAGAWFRC